MGKRPRLSFWETSMSEVGGDRGPGGGDDRRPPKRRKQGEPSSSSEHAAGAEDTGANLRSAAEKRPAEDQLQGASPPKKARVVEDQGPPHGDSDTGAEHPGSWSIDHLLKHTEVPLPPTLRDILVKMQSNKVSLSEVRNGLASPEALAYFAATNAAPVAQRA